MQQYPREKELRKSLKQVDNAIIEEEVELRRRRRANIANINLHETSSNSITFYSGLLPSSPREHGGGGGSSSGGGGGANNNNSNHNKLLKQLMERKLKIEKELAECMEKLIQEDI